MAFKRSSVRSRLSPPKKKDIQMDVLFSLPFWDKKEVKQVIFCLLTIRNVTYCQLWSSLSPEWQYSVENGFGGTLGGNGGIGIGDPTSY